MDVGGGPGHGEDPGWSISWRVLLASIWPSLLINPRKQRGPEPRVTLLRQIFVAFAAGPVLFLPILAILLPLRDPAEPVSAVVPGLLVASAVSLAVARWSSRRPLPCEDEDTLADAYRKNFFLGVAFANAASLYGFVAAFIAMGFWPYLISLPLGLLGLRTVAPTAANLERAEQRLMMSGCAASLRAALYAPATPPVQ